jgi:Cytidylyltransferase-like
MNIVAPEVSAFFALAVDYVCLRSSASVPAALLPGSFNPIHAGHWCLRTAAAQHLGVEVDFELSIHNVDKPALPVETALQRARQFTGRARLWLTRAPTFLEKARLFPGTVFVVGADTAERILAPRYYRDSAALQAALDNIRQLGCSFLVAGRVDERGCLRALEHLTVPPDYADLFRGLPDFRVDISSTQLRTQQG